MARVSRQTDKTDKRTPDPDRQISSLGDCLDCPDPVFGRWMDLGSVATCVEELKEFNRRWGYGRSFRLAGDELAGKLRRQLELLETTAREAKTGYLVEQRAEAMVRGLRLANERIALAGHQPVDRTEWAELHPSGMVVKLVKTRAAVPADSAEAYFALEDIVKWIPKEVLEIMKAFPGSSVTSVTTKFNEERERTAKRLEAEAVKPKAETPGFEDMDDDIPW
jgi:hypothetical protein